MDAVDAFELRLVGDAFALLLGAFEPAKASKAPVRLKSEIARRVADDILAAEDRADLVDRLLDHAFDQEFWEAELPKKTDPAAKPLTKLPPLDVTSLERVLGSTATARCGVGHDALNKILVRVGELWKLASLVLEKIRAEHPPKKSLARDPNQPFVLYFATSEDVPVSARRGVQKFLRFLMATCAIARAEERGQKLAPWLALALADEYSQPAEQLFKELTTGTDAEIVTRIFGSILADIEASVATRRLMEHLRQKADESGEGHASATLGDAETR